MKFLCLLFVVCLQACEKSDSKEFFCESRQQYQFNDFIPQYIVQLGTRKICVIWSADATHCGVDGEKLLSPWYVSEATGTKTQFAYRAIFSPQEVEFVITRNEVLIRLKQLKNCRKRRKLHSNFIKKNLSSSVP